MNIGILTYHRSHNYGALFQAYALQKYLRISGYYVEVIDYWPGFHKKSYSLFPHFNREISLKGNVKQLLIFCFGFFRILKRRNGYKYFAKSAFKLKTHPRFSENRSIDFSNYDVIIYGSDQIWRKQEFPGFKGFNDSYFGCNTLKKQKKISYAASMGKVIVDDDDLDYLSRMLKNFDSISVREAELKKVIVGLTEKEVSLVLDPVFLLDRKAWDEIIPKRIISEKYILLYQISDSPESIILSNRLRNDLGIRVVEIRGRVNSFLYGQRYRQTETPYEFLSLLRNAELVVTTSFHGTAFSVIFEKQFYALGMGDSADRVLTLLSLLGIENRYINDINTHNTSGFIDYEDVIIKLEKLIRNSVSFLRKALYD